jgi:hypothetical protein
MEPTPSSRAYGYDNPPVLIHHLVYGTTWSCPGGRGQISVDVIRLVESVGDVRDFNSDAIVPKMTPKPRPTRGSTGKRQSLW